MNAETTFRENLQNLRKERKMTQSDVAAKLGISDKTYSKWETGENDPDLSSILKLADCFEVEPSALFTGEREDVMSTIDREIGGLPVSDAVNRAFALQFAAVRSLAKHAFKNQTCDETTTAIPENLVDPGSDHSITAYACPGTFMMQYNGSDANIGLSMLPARDNFGWLMSERARLSEYLSLFGEEDFLAMFTVMIGFGQAERFTAEFIASKVGIESSRAAGLLERAKRLDIVSSAETHVGDRTLELFRVDTDQMPLGMLTLAHLSLPGAKKHGCWYVNSFARQIMTEGSVK